MMIRPTPPITDMDTLNKQLTAIAQKYLGIDTLEPRNSDRLDFHDVGVASLLDALTATFEAGRREGQMQNRRDRPTLFEAARDGDLPQVQARLDQGSGAQELIDDGTTALMVAAYNGHKDVVELLIGRGAPLNAQDKDGCTALMRAAWQGHTEIVGLLISQGAAVNIQDQSGESALMNAARRGRTEIVKMLLGAGADIEQRDWRGQTAEDIATLFDKHEAKRLLTEHTWAELIHANLRGAIAENNLHLLRRTLDGGPYVDTPDAFGRTPLSWAAELGHVEAMTELLDRGASVNILDRNARAPLMWAAGGSSPDAVQLLIDRGAPINARDNDGRTALIRAAELGSADVVALLVSQGAVVDLQDHAGMNALMHAAQHGCTAVAQWLLNAGADYDQLVRYVDPVTQEARGVTAEDLADIYSHSSTRAVLGAHRLRGALRRTAETGDLDQMRALLESGADLHLRLDDGSTALTSAAAHGHQEMVHLLLQHGAPIDAPDRDGLTALMRAAIGGRVAVVRTLLDAGADASVQADYEHPRTRCTSTVTAEDLAGIYRRDRAQELLAGHRHAQDQEQER